jgi:hypothetical protein
MIKGLFTRLTRFAGLTRFAVRRLKKNPKDFLIRVIGSAELTFRKNPQDLIRVIRKNSQDFKFVQFV